MYRGSYQRMEFLGDAVLQFLASLYVYSHFPNHREGHLSVSCVMYYACILTVVPDHTHFLLPSRCCVPRWCITNS